LLFAVITSELESEVLVAPWRARFLVMRLGVCTLLTHPEERRNDEHSNEDSPAADFELLHLTDGG
jgi:hypothetical protein